MGYIVYENMFQALSTLYADISTSSANLYPWSLGGFKITKPVVTYMFKVQKEQPTLNNCDISYLIGTYCLNSIIETPEQCVKSVHT